MVWTMYQQTHVSRGANRVTGAPGSVFFLPLYNQPAWLDKQSEALGTDWRKKTGQKFYFLPEEP